MLFEQKIVARWKESVFLFIVKRKPSSGCIFVRFFYLERNNEIDTMLTHVILFIAARATECDVERRLTVVDLNEGATKRLELRLNDEHDFASPMGLCHYQLATGELSSLSVNRDNQAQGFYSTRDHMFDVFHRDGVTYQKPAILKNGTRCGIETFVDDDADHDDQAQLIRRRRRSKETEPKDF